MGWCVWRRRLLVGTILGGLAPIIFFKTLQDTAPHRNALHHTWLLGRIGVVKWSAWSRRLWIAALFAHMNSHEFTWIYRTHMNLREYITLTWIYENIVHSCDCSDSRDHMYLFWSDHKYLFQNNETIAAIFTHVSSREYSALTWIYVNMQHSRGYTTLTWIHVNTAHARDYSDSRDHVYLFGSDHIYSF